MKRIELGSALVLSLALGTLMIFGRTMIGSFSSNNFPYYEIEDPIQEVSTAAPTPISASPVASQKNRPDPTATVRPLKVAEEKGEDITDVLLLHDPTAPANFDTNFCLLAVYYGLLCQRLALNAARLTDDSLRDTEGAYFKLIGISASSMYSELLDDNELAVLSRAVIEGGSTLYISKLSERRGIIATAVLTRNAILGVEMPADGRRDWQVTITAPEITQEFTGQVVSPARTIPQNDYALTIGGEAHVTPLITSTDDTGRTYPIFVRWQQGIGGIFIDAGMADENIGESGLAQLYFDREAFTQIMPLIFAIRSTFDQEAWHNDHSYANLTIDDPPLNNNLFHGEHFMKYHQLLAEMERHNFHTTIALVPDRAQQSEPDVTGLFTENPERYSIVQHGNNHDGFEFYKYTVSAEDEWPARPWIEQERDIVEGLSRMWAHTYQMGVSFDQIMIFPYGNAPCSTLKVLKERNYLADVQGAQVPFDAPDPDSIDYMMFPAHFGCENFPMVYRSWIQTWDPDTNRYDPLRPVYELFLDRPALLFSHHGEMFGIGIDGFSPIADQINNLEGHVEWRSLGEIIRHLYWEKVNDDGSIDIRMFSNNRLVVTNVSAQQKSYHIFKEETLNVPILSLTVNGHDFPYTVQDGFLNLNVILPAYEAMDLVIEYGL